MEQQENSDRYNKKVASLEYRHVNKQVNGKKKYYYTLQPGSSFISKISGPSTIQMNPKLSNLKNVQTLVMKTGSTYSGELNDRNERHGYGIYQVINGGHYEGHWVNGFKQGKGAFYYKGGQIQYKGDWECGEPHGYGEIYNQSGVLKYQGAFRNGKSDDKIYWLDYKNK